MTRLDLVKEFHKKFQVPIKEKLDLAQDRSEFRFELILSEILEYRDATINGDLENIAKELVDILYSVYGTILEHGLQSKLDELFEEVHNSNMSKEFSEYKMIKGPNYREANIRKILE